MPDEDRYTTLVDKILKTGWLLSDPRAYTPSDATEVLASKQLVHGYSPSAPVDEMYLHQVVCFCDIPSGDLEIHMRNPSSGSVGDHRKRSPFASLTTTIRVGNGSEMPAKDILTMGPSTTQRSSPTGFGVFMGS